MQKKGRLAAWSLLLLCILVSGLCFSAKAEDTCQPASLEVDDLWGKDTGMGSGISGVQ